MGLDLNGLSAFRPARDKDVASQLKMAEIECARIVRRKTRAAEEFLDEIARRWEAGE